MEGLHLSASMVRLTLIARQRDGLPLAEGLDNDKDPDLTSYKQQAKVCVHRQRWDRCQGPQWLHVVKPLKVRCAVQTLFKKFASQTKQLSERLSIEASSHTFHILFAHNVCFLTLAEKGYNKKLAFQYLEELASEFSRLYGPQIEAVSRPYAFIKFGATLIYKQATV